MKNFITTLLLGFLLSHLYANSPIFLDLDFNWSPQSNPVQVGNQQLERWSFKGAFFADEFPLLPFAVQEFQLSTGGQPVVRILEVAYEDFKWLNPPELLQTIGPELQFETSVERDRGQYFGKLSFCPIVRSGNQLRRVTRIRLEITPQNGGRVVTRSNPFVRESALATGTLYKMAVSQEGIYKLSYRYLKDELGVNIDGIDPRRIRILGNRGGMAPELVDEDKTDDLVELPVWIQGEADGSFDSGDYLLFYAEGPDRWIFEPTTNAYRYEKNIFADNNYYFLKIGDDNGRRITNKASVEAPALEVTSFNDRRHVEEDKVNLLFYWGETLGKAQGSGKNWYDDHFKNVRSYKYPKLFNIPNLVPGATAQLEIRMALRAEERSRFQALVNGTIYQSDYASSIPALSGPNDNINNYANAGLLKADLTLNSPEVDLEITYPYPAGSGDGSEAWLDYVQLHSQRQLVMTGTQMDFRSIATKDYPNATYRLQTGQTGLLIWDITDPLNAQNQQFNTTGNNLVFGTDTPLGTVRDFIAFEPASVNLVPEAVGAIPNQNLHALDELDMVIVSPEALLAEAQTLAEHRRRYSGLQVAVVSVDQIYNEFSSGRLDPAAIRDFARMLYTRNARFRYLLLFGDGSFDHKNVYGLGNNLIPTYQQDSFNPLFAFPSDDYYGLLELPESASPLRGRLNIGIGRLPVRKPEEAAQAVNKIIKYDTNPDSYSDWRNRLVFVADDEDSGGHVIDADAIARDVGGQFPALNLDKIYLDAYPQVSTPGGNRFPDVTEAINQSIFKGSLVITYLGHGGAEGWAQERVLNISDIVNWRNLDRQPLLLTATCSFTGYDDAAFTTAGEEAFLNPQGGAIALMTTVRAVYANQNAALTEAALRELFSKENGSIPTLGEAIRDAKNSFTSTSITTNSRKFTLIGDPAQRLAIPQFRVATTQIDTHTVATGSLDTLRALQKVTIQGQIIDNNGGRMEAFNGILFPTVFDKKLQLTTLGQDNSSRVLSYQLQKNIIFKGRVTVDRGAFSFSFIIPKDINYQFGPGKISYYASDPGQLNDAAGNYEQIIIGGNLSEKVVDDQGPKIDVFLNSEDFAFGGLTDANPTLLVKLEDDFGINVVGNSIGHDLEAVLDEDTQNTLLLNDFFESELDDFTKGEVRFPLADLEEGLHRIQIKAWDVANNSAEGYTEFIVAGSEGLALEHVLNYPNPFTDRTCFQFDHNYANQELDVLIQIFTISGRLVKTIEANLFSDGAIRQDDCIEWNGRDDFGDPLARGIYLYKVKVRASVPGSEPVTGESKFEKLVLLK